MILTWLASNLRLVLLGGAVIGITGATWYAWHTHNKNVARAAVAEITANLRQIELDAKQREVELYKATIESSERLTKNREELTRKLLTARKERKDETEKLVRDNPEFATWHNTSHPDIVNARLRKHAQRANSTEPSDSGDGATRSNMQTLNTLIRWHHKR